MRINVDLIMFYKVFEVEICLKKRIEKCPFFCYDFYCQDNNHKRRKGHFRMIFSTYNSNMTGEILQDVKSGGEERPWREK